MTSLRAHKNDMELKCSFERKFVFIKIKTYIDGNGIFEEIGDMFNIRKNRNKIIREKRILETLF